MVHTITRYCGVDSTNINQWTDKRNGTQSTEPDPHLWKLEHIRGDIEVTEKKMEQSTDDAGTISSIYGKTWNQILHKNHTYKLIPGALNTQWERQIFKTFKITCVQYLNRLEFLK